MNKTTKAKQTKELNTMMNLNEIKNQLLEEIESEKGFSFRKLAKIIELNNEIESDDNLGRGFKIGHSYLCAEDLSDESLKAIVQYEIIPLLEEYWYDEPSKVEKWSQELLSALK